MERGAGGRERGAEAERVEVKVHEIGSGEKGREVREG